MGLPADGSFTNLDVSNVARFSGPLVVAPRGTVTQLTNRSTGVTVNTRCGTITTNTASLAAEASAVFVVTNNTVGINDTVILSQQSGANGGNTLVQVDAVAEGSFSIRVLNQNAAAGTAETGAILINFAVVKCDSA